MIVVSDTTPISELAKIGRLALLREVYQRVIIPYEVYNEVMAGPQIVVVAAEATNWIEAQAVNDSNKVLALHASSQLGLGECAALILAEEVGGTDSLWTTALGAAKQKREACLLPAR